MWTRPACADLHDNPGKKKGQLCEFGNRPTLKWVNGYLDVSFAFDGPCINSVWWLNHVNNWVLVVYTSSSSSMIGCVGTLSLLLSELLMLWLTPYPSYSLLWILLVSVKVGMNIGNSQERRTAYLHPTLWCRVHLLCRWESLPRLRASVPEATRSEGSV